MNDKCTQEQAQFWLYKRIDEDFEKLNSFCKLHNLVLTDNQGAAILSFCFRCEFKTFVASSMAKDLIDNKPNVANRVAAYLLIRNENQNEKIHTAS